MKLEREIRFIFLLSQGCGALAAGMGFVALLGWIIKIPILSSFGSQLIPMAPSTALLFLLLGMAISFYAHSPNNRVANLAGITIGLLGTFISLLIFILSSLGFYLAAEYLGIPIIGTLNRIPIGHMSPMTALSFILANLSFLAMLSISSSNPRRIIVVIGLAS